LLPTIAKLVVAAAPFLAIQLVQNIGVAGSWDTLAEAQYVRQTDPAPLIGFYKIDPAKVPWSSRPERQQEMKELLLPAYQQHRLDNFADWSRARLARTYGDTLPHPMFVLLFPMALLAMRDPRRIVLVASLILFMIFYFLNPFYLEHYTVAIICPMLALVFMAWEAAESAWPVLRPAVGTFLTVLLVALSIGNLPEVNPARRADFGAYAELRQFDRALEGLPPGRALVMFQSDLPGSHTFYVDPAYNESVVFPDEARIVRAHDLGESENRKLYQYYAQRQPDRVVYIYDRSAWRRGANPLSPPQGTVAEMAGK